MSRRGGQPTASTGGGGGGGGGGSNPDYGSQLFNWLTAPAAPANVATQLVVPDTGVGSRVMTAGTMSAAAATRSQYVTVKCFTQYGTQLDLSQGGWKVSGTGHLPYKIILVGFDIINGSMNFDWMDDLVFVSCRFQTPIQNWLNMYANKNGGVYPAWGSVLSSSVLNALGPNYTATPFRLSFNGTSWNTGLQLHLCRGIHIGDDFIFSNGSWVALYGCDGGDAYHHNNIFYNPGQPGLSYMHNDWVQNRGGGNTRIKNSLCGAHLQLATEETGSQTLDIGVSGASPGVLIAGSVDGCATCDDGTTGQHVNGSIYARAVCNAQFIDDGGTYHSQPQYPVSGGTPDTFWEYGVSGSTSNLTKNVTFGMDGSGAPPAGVPLVGGSNPATQRLMQNLKSQYDANPSLQSHNLDDLLNSSDNPARAIQQAWPYSNIDQYIATQITLG
jgi:hypothetical protein